MNENVTAFIIVVLSACVLIGIGISGFFSNKTLGFWANIKNFPVKDIKGYNRATGKLFIFYGLLIIVSGFPILGEQNTPYILFTLICPLIGAIAIMAIYVLVIEEKYKDK